MAEGPTTPLSNELDIKPSFIPMSNSNGGEGGTEPLLTQEAVPCKEEDPTEFWRRYLADAPPLLEVNTDFPRVSGTPSKTAAGSFEFRLDSSLVDALQVVARAGDTTIWVVFMTAWQILLARYSRAEDVVVGTYVVNSEGATRKLPVRLELAGAVPSSDPSIERRNRRQADYIEMIRKATKDLEVLCSNSVLPFEDLITAIGGPSSDSAPPVFQASFSAPWDSTVSFEKEWVPCHRRKILKSVSCDLELHMQWADGVLAAISPTISNKLRFPKTPTKLRGMQCTLLYRSSLFDKLTARRMARHFQVLLAGLVEKQGRIPWYEIPLMLPDERAAVIERANNTDAPYPLCCIHDQFEEQAVAHPDRPCVLYNGQTLTYLQVYAQSMALADTLRELGAKPDQAVPLLLERSDLMTVAIYGILLSGAAYVPLDVDYPPDRLQHIIDDCDAEILVTCTALNGKVPPTYKKHVVCIDFLLRQPRTDDATVLKRASTRRKELQQSPDSLVYIFYTSGTTGKPKGVEVTHRGLVKRIAWLQHVHQLTPSDRVMNKTPYVFGISEWEFFWPLPYGAGLVVAKEGGQKDPEYLYDLTVKEKVTVATYVPSMLSVTIEYMAGEGANYTTDMRVVICCGEVLPVETCHRFFEVFDPKKAKLHNLYGPTEADMTYWECPPLTPGDLTKRLKKIPIGLPMDNVKVYVLDQRQQPVPAGVPGELYFGGLTTARGYVKLPELTAEKFVPNPFRSPRDCERMYRTGDCVRWLPDLSNLEFLGRVDNQVKLRGFRIELGEIECVVGQCPGVAKAAVIVHGKQAASQRLIAYVVPESVDVRAVINMAKSRLPEYMVPSVVVPLADLPVTSRGKLDRKALPEPPTDDFLGSGGKGRAAKFGDPDFVGASTATQKAVEAVWQHILGRTDPLSIHADFVMLGGNSLLAGKATTEIRKKTGAQIPATSMYTHPTIAKIAEVCDSKKASEEAPKGYSIGGNLDKPYGGKDASCAVMLALFLGMIFSLFIGQASFIPGWIFLFNVYSESGILVCVLLIPPVLAVTVLAVALYAIFMKRMVMWRLQPGEYEVYSWYYVRWWFAANLTRGTNAMVGSICEGTSLFNWYLRGMGAVIGDNVEVHTEEIHDPDLVRIDSGTELERKSVVICHSIENGRLTLMPVHIGSDCLVQPVAHVVQGSYVPDGSVVGPLSTTGFGAHRNIKPLERSGKPRTHSGLQDFLRVFVGIPFLFILEAAAMFPLILFMEWVWDSIPGDSDSNEKYIKFCFVVAWLYKFALPDLIFLIATLFKWTVIGRFKTGRRPYTTWDEFRRWLWERIIKLKMFEEALEPWINTEILSCKYRLLGARFGWKVHADYIDMIEHDLVTVGTDCVFGSKVVLHTTDHVESRPIVVQREGQILDHTTLMPGVVVGMGALCGSSTVGAKFHQFVPHSINTGNQGGRAVQLRIKGDVESGGLAHLPDKERMLALQGLRNHHSHWRWGLFNLFNIVVVLIIFAFPAIIELISVLLWLWLQQYDEFYYGWTGFLLCMAITPPIYQVLYLVEGLVVTLIKWIIVGRYKEGDFPFYASYHRKWVVMMTCKLVMNHLVEEMNGTPFIVWFMRINGAKVGRNVVCFGDALEYDLLEVGDCASIGEKCDITCHTVENMVIKLAPVIIGKQCTLRAGAFVMPGGVMLEGSVLMEVSQVLKGETVAADAVYAGQPAEPCSRYLPELSPWKVESEDIEMGAAQPNDNEPDQSPSNSSSSTVAQAEAAEGAVTLLTKTQTRFAEAF